MKEKGDYDENEMIDISNNFTSRMKNFFNITFVIISRHSLC